MIIEMVAILSCVSFAGAAIYINVAEHPARLECGTELAATVFGPSYARAAVMQASLAIIATIAGLAAGLLSGFWGWYVGAALVFSVVPFTFIVIMPTNKLLLDPELDRSSAETLALLKKWGQLHGVRSIASALASIIYVYLGVST